MNQISRFVPDHQDQAERRGMAVGKFELLEKDTTISLVWRQHAKGD